MLMTNPTMIVFAHVSKDGETVKALIDTGLIAVCLANGTGTQIVMKGPNSTAIQAENSFDDIVEAIGKAHDEVIPVTEGTEELCQRVFTPQPLVLP